MTVEPLDAELAELDEELADAKASLRRLRDRTLREYRQHLETETDPYRRQWLIDSINKAQAVVVD